jgi:hypothetical protein
MRSAGTFFRSRGVPQLFSYGTLQDPDVQFATFGRHLRATRDELIGFELDTVRIDDAEFVARSGKAVHSIVWFTGRPDSRVSGAVLELTEAELAQADAYEPAGFTRVRGKLASGGEAWVYAGEPAVFSR